MGFGLLFLFVNDRFLLKFLLGLIRSAYADVQCPTIIIFLLQCVNNTVMMVNTTILDRLKISILQIASFPGC